MSTNPFRNKESYKFMDGSSPVPTPAPHPKLRRVSASTPALNEWWCTADTTATVPIVDGVEDVLPRGSPGPAMGAESFANLSEVSRQDLNGGTPPIALTGMSDADTAAGIVTGAATGTITGSTTAVAPASTGTSGQGSFQVSQRRARTNSRLPVPLFTPSNQSEPARCNLVSSLHTSYIPTVGTRVSKPKYRSPWWTAPSRIKAGCSIWPLAVLTNMPFLTLFLIDIIGTHNRGSKFYRHNLDLRFGRPGPIVFQFFYVIVGLGTALANITFLGTFIDHVSRKWGMDKGMDMVESEGTTRKFPFDRSRTLHCAGVVVLVFGLLLGVVFAVAGPIAAPFVAIRTHTLPVLVPGAATCIDYGYKTTIVLRVSDSETANSTNLDGTLIYSNATFYSESTTPFTMDLIPYHDPNHRFPSTYLFVFNPSGIDENDVLHLRLSNVSVGYDLLGHTYQFKFDSGRGTGTLTEGTMHDDPYDAESLSFPDLPYPVRSMAGKGWVSRTPLIQPHVDFIRYFSDPKDIPLKTESDFAGVINCAMVRMCARESVESMLTDELEFQSMLVPVGRFLVEVARFAGGLYRPGGTG